MAHLRVGVRDALGLKSPVHGTPGLASVIGTEHARSGNSDEDAVRIARVDNDRVQAHPAGPRLPGRPRPVAADAGQLVPVPAAIGRAEQCRVLDAGKYGVGIGQGRFEMPDSCELPRVRRPVVPLVRAGHAVVLELVPDGLPGRPPVVGALDELPEPAVGL